MIKGIIIASFILQTAFHEYLDYLDNSYLAKELPDNVKDVYDEERYKKWQSYEKDRGKVSIIKDIVTGLLLFSYLAFDVYSKIFNAFSAQGIYLQYLLMMVSFELISLVVSIPFSYYSIFVIEEKYGMNKTTKKTFVLDIIKETIISVVVSYGLLMLVRSFFERFGNMAIIITAVAFILLSLLINLIVMPILRIFNKFDSLEDGELKDAILGLCHKYGMTVRKLCVRDASRRTTKANAFCTGLTKKKTISLDDNLVNEYSTDQIVSVFAHEFGHAKFNHMIKSLPFSFTRTVITVLALGVILNFKVLFQAFGFSEVNYYFAFLLIELISWPVSLVFDLIGNHMSRKHEYEADAFAAKEGYGEALISALKKLSGDALSNLNPHPFVVKIGYSHPTLSQRIDAIRAIEE